MRKLAVIGAALLAVAASASAQDFKKVDGLLPGRAEFDVPDGHYQSWEADVGCKANAVRGFVTFKRLGKPTTKWPPALAINLMHGDTLANNKMVQFSVVAPRFTPSFGAQLNAMSLGPDSDLQKLLDVQNYAAVVGGDEPIPFSVTWSADGEVSASFGGEVHTVSLQAPIDRIKIAGSSGAGVLEPLEIGTVGDLEKMTGCKPIAGSGAPPAGKGQALATR